MVAPASKAACVLSTCSDTLIGTAGLFSFFGSDPVIATQMMQGLDMFHAVPVSLAPFEQGALRQLFNFPSS
ncbi:hypothetical protein LAB1_21580 [Roseibium sp. LAB1]